MSDVVIHYRRLPDRNTVFRQRLVHRTADCIVTFMPHTKLAAPARVNDVVILEPDAPVVWFTFPERWHDIGRFHDGAGNFTGYYANILEPVTLRSELEWDATDLFLDVWLSAAGDVQLLDEAELDDALRDGAISPERAAAARQEADRLMALAASGAWPPAIAREWTLERVVRHTG